MGAGAKRKIAIKTRVLENTVAKRSQLVWGKQRG